MPGLLDLALALAWIAILICGLAVYQLVQQNGRILIRLEALERHLGRALSRPPTPPNSQQPTATSPPLGLEPGTVTNDFDLPTLDGGRMTRSQWLGQRLLLVFVDPRCGFSRAILPELAAVPPEPADGRPQPILVCGGDPEENRRLAEEHGLRWPAVLQEGGELSLLYKVYGTPMAYLVDERGATVGRPAVGGAAVVALVGGGGPPTVASPADERPATDFTPGPADDPLSPPDGAADGSPAPDFRLPRLDGGELSLAEFRGQRLLLVFWAADCPACERLAPRLEVLHRLGSGPRVLAIARGDPAALRLQAERLGLSFPIALQDGWAVSRRYGPPGTPIAYVVDEQGRVAGPPAVGVSEIAARMRALLAASAPAGAGLHRA